MRPFQWLCLLVASACAHPEASVPYRDHDKYDYFALHLHEDARPQEIAQLLGAHLEGPLGSLPNHFTYSAPKAHSAQVEDSLQDLRRRRLYARNVGIAAGNSGLEGVRWHQKQQLRKRLVKRIPPPPLDKRQGPPAGGATQLDAKQQAALEKLDDIATVLDIKDPIFKEQWHLYNYVQLGIDVNVTGVWQQGITGNGTIAAIVDDGLDFNSKDLSPNYFALGSYDFNDHHPDPKPRLSDDRHGTRCAGEIGAAKNDVCGVGVAYGSKIAGIRILSAPISDEDEALAINYHYEENDIYSCSWGPPDDGRTMEEPGILIKKAMVNGVQQGRSGRGSIFVFAAGNGANNDDNCNFDGYTNSIYSITTGAIDRFGDHPYYSEKCSALLIVTPSSGHGDAIHTTDVGEANCYSGHGGTSAAGPLMVGAVALALSARPELTWRDLQYLAIETAIPIHLNEEGEWQDTAMGKKFSHTYGYGKLDIYAFVEAAKTYQLRKPQAWWHSPWISVQHDIPEGNQGLAASFEVTKAMMDEANLAQLEHVTVTMNVKHTRRGDLSVELRSPAGKVSHISTTRRNDDIAAGYADWTFMSVLHWGEKGEGTWTVVVKDTVINDHNGTFVDWRLNLWGEAIDAAKQPLHPLPDEHDDDHQTAIGVVTTTSVDSSQPTNSLGNPTDHIDRPTKPKPTDAADTPSTTTMVPDPPSTFTHPAFSPTGSSEADLDTEKGKPASDSFLPGFFPTFGVSKRTQIWIYGSIGLIVVFCLGLGVYFLVQRRKRLRNSRDNYEFEMLEDEDADEAKQGLTGGRKGRRKRGGELYDAFAGESDEEIFSDDEAYQDTPEKDAGSTSHDSSRDSNDEK